jgi:hypothetical protein
MERFFEFSTQLFQIRLPEELDLAMVEAGDQQEIIRVRELAAREAAGRIHDDVEQFVSDCVTTLREQTAGLCEEMLASMRDSKTGVHQKTLNRLVRFVDEFRKLNFVGDQEMEAQLEAMRKEFLGRTAQQYRDSASARAQLEGGLSNLRNHARQLAQQDTRDLVDRFGALGRRRLHLAA